MILKNHTPVIFRVFQGDVIALFPYIDAGQGLITSYQHIGQHSAADYQHVMSNSRRATKDEYLRLFKELTDIGYCLAVMQKKSSAREKYLKRSLTY